MENNIYLKWLEDNQKTLNISLINSELKLPEGTLAKWLKGERTLPEKHIPVIERHIKKLIRPINK